VASPIDIELISSIDLRLIRSMYLDMLSVRSNPER